MALTETGRLVFNSVTEEGRRAFSGIVTEEGRRVFGAGGQTFSETPSATISLSTTALDPLLAADALQQTFIFSPASDDVTGQAFTETPSATVIFAAALSDAGTLAQAPSAAIAFQDVLLDVSTAVEQPSLNATLAPALSDAQAMVVLVALALSGATTDTLNEATATLTLSPTAATGVVVVAPALWFSSATVFNARTLVATVTSDWSSFFDTLVLWTEHLDSAWASSAFVLELIDYLLIDWFWFSLPSFVFKHAAVADSEWVSATATSLGTEGLGGGSWGWTDILVDQSVYPHPVFTRSWSFTASNVTDVFTAAGHALHNGDAVTLEGAGLPGGVVAGTTYYAVNVSGDTFQLSASLGGSPIDLSSSGSGTVYANVGGTSPDGTALSPLPAGVPSEVVMKR